MSISFPTRKLTKVDVPEVENLRVSFSYNFFTPDERTNFEGSAPKGDLIRPGEFLSGQRVDDATRRIPRFVRIDFSTPDAVNVERAHEFLTKPPNVNKPMTVREALEAGKLQTELVFSNDSFSGLDFQDTNVDKKLFFLVSGSIAKRSTARNRNVMQQIEDTKQRLIDRLSEKNSLFDSSRALNDLVSANRSDVSSNFIVEALTNLRALGLKFIDNDAQEEKTKKSFDRVRNVAVKAQFNNKIYGDIIRSCVNDPVSIFNDELSYIVRDAESTQSEFLSTVNPSQVSESDYEPVFEALNVEPLDPSAYGASSEIIGYVVERSLVRPDGTIRILDPITIENPASSVVIDPRVIYGGTYIYRVRVVARVTISAISAGTDDVILATGYVSSRGARGFVTCIENVPPPPPSDFNVIWDYQNRAPRLMWSMPCPNTQRDVKRFQVFKRTARRVTGLNGTTERVLHAVESPFVLVKEYDFDDSVIRTLNNETPSPDLVERSDAAIMNHLDLDFDRDSTAIYAVCAIDAHALTSNYSIQYEIGYDRFKNRITKKIISQSGAPKSYPNLYLNQDTFQDTIRDSGHSRARLYFDPEVLALRNAEGDDLDLVVTEGKGGSYRLQLINTDLQSQEVIDVIVRDLR